MNHETSSFIGEAKGTQRTKSPGALCISGPEKGTSMRAKLRNGTIFGLLYCLPCRM